MKIHFLEEAMAKRGKEFNQAALKENTDLKVNRITMQRELHKFKKNIAQAERDAEVYRLQLEEYRERMKRRQADESVRIEVERMQAELKTKDAQIEKMQEELDSAEEKERVELGKLRDEIGDLEADLRERDRAIEDKEDQIEALKENTGKESRAAAELEEELENARRQIDELQEDLERAAAEVKEAREERQEAVDEKKQAEENLDELRDEMMNKSFTTKGLSRQLEEKTNKLEDDLHEMQERHRRLQSDFEDKVQNEKRLQERLRVLEKEGAAEHKQLQRDFESAQQQLDAANRKLDNTSKELRSAEHELRIKTDEKGLLQSRHDALTTESAGLQQDLIKSQRAIRELEEALEEERQHAAQNDAILRSQHKTDIDHLTDQIDSLHREVSAKEGQYSSDQEEWESDRRTLEAARQKAEERANGLQRTVAKLQEAEGTLSSRELKLQQALESEKQRHQEEEKVLSRQIEDLNKDLAAKRDASDTNRSELSNAKEELRISIREQAVLREKVNQLEEEIEVLQANLEEEAEFAEQQRNKSIEGIDAQLRQVRQEKQSLQDQLANINLELHKTKKAAREAEADKDELEARLRRAEKPADDTFNVDPEKRELRRTKLKLEKDLDRIKADRDSLSQANEALEQEINAEIERGTAEEHRLQLEIDLLRNRQASSSEARDRELTSYKNKTQRLETRIQELEGLLDNQPAAIASPTADVSGLKHELSESRKNESASKKRETDLKAKTRDLQAQIVSLERELHEAQLAQFKLKSPSASPPPSHPKELAQLRKDLVDARSQLQDARNHSHALERASRKVLVDETERADLHALLKSSTLEAEALALKLANREAQISEMNTQLKRLRRERESVTRKADEATRELDSQLDEMKGQLQRLRDERGTAVKRAEAVSKELDSLQARYESVVEKLHSGKGKAREHDKAIELDMEVKGLMKEIVWLKARYSREVEMRRRLAWIKLNPLKAEEAGETWYVLLFLYLLEHMLTSHRNGIDLKLLRELGVRVSKNALSPRQKFRAGVFAVIASVRMRSQEQHWRGVKALGEELRRQKNRDKGAVLGRWVNAALVN
jgi:chromosome segregation ATPase